MGMEKRRAIDSTYGKINRFVSYRNFSKAALYSTKVQVIFGLMAVADWKGSQASMDLSFSNAFFSFESEKLIQ